MRAANIGRYVPAIAAVALLLAGIFALYRFYADHLAPQTIERRDGQIITEVIDARLVDAGDLRVKQLRGSAQAVAVDQRAGGLLVSTLVMKAPFAVDYFVDISKLGRRDFLWNERARTLTVTVPDVRAGAVNVDEAHAAIRTTGPFVTRAAMAALRRSASLTAQRIAREEAVKPAYLDPTRRDARAMIAALFARPLRIAGQDVTVRVRFAGEPEDDLEEMDRSRSLAEIYAQRAPAP